MGKLEKAKRLAQQTKSHDVANNIYINVCGMDGNMAHFEYADEYNDINSELELKQFSDAQIARQVCIEYGERKDTLYVTAAALVQRHLDALDTKLANVVKEQKHNSFTIIVDTTDVYKAFVYSSTPADKDYSKQHSAVMYQSYSQAIKSI